MLHLIYLSLVYMVFLSTLAVLPAPFLPILPPQLNRGGFFFYNCFLFPFYELKYL
jgi:hypothetical protein